MPTSAQSRLAGAIEVGRRILVESQEVDGSWREAAEIGPASTAQTLVTLHYLGSLTDDQLAEGTRWLCGQQRTDGSFERHPFAGCGDLATTAVAWAALALSRSPRDQLASARARTFVARYGGLEAVVDSMRTGDVSALFVAMGGLLEARRLPCPSLALAVADAVVDRMSTRVHYGVVLGGLELALLARHLRGDFDPDRPPRDAAVARQCSRAVDMLTLFQNGDGSWNGNTLQTALALAALRAAGLTVGDARVARGIGWLQSRVVREACGLHFALFENDVWTTAWYLRALLDTGSCGCDDHVVRAIDWLCDRQSTVPQPVVNNRRPGALRTGGWPFQRANETMVDCDDTGVVLAALGQALDLDSPRGGLPFEIDKRARMAVQLGRAWLEGMQNPDGGWSAFVWGLPGKRPGPTMTRPLNLPPDDPIAWARALADPPLPLTDPSTEDVTARVISGLVRTGAQRDPAIVRAIAFLRRQQCDTGAWWGRWVVNYLPATATVLSALVAAGEDPSNAYIERAIEWILARQNDDGGFGEAVESYRDPDLAGCGSSTCPLTAFVITGLVDAGAGHRPEVGRAVDYLLARQRADGTWPNDDYLATNVPPDDFYFYAGAARYLPLQALGRYSLLAEGGSMRPVRDQTCPHYAFLAGMRQKGDPAPELALAQSAEQCIDSLPPWADRARVALAKETFARHSAQFIASFLCAALPSMYAGARGAAVLASTELLTHNVRERMFRSAQFVFDVMDPGSLARGGRGLRAVQAVRRGHERCRQSLVAGPNAVWDTSKLGVPINQEDLVGTLMTLSVVTFDAVGRLGVKATKADADAWVHTWNVVGHVLGVEPTLLPHDISEARGLWDVVRLRNWAPSGEGRQLARALMEAMQEIFTLARVDGLTAALVRHLAGDECADILGIDASLPTSALVRMTMRTAATVDWERRAPWLSRKLGESVIAAMKDAVEAEVGATARRTSGSIWSHSARLLLRTRPAQDSTTDGSSRGRARPDADDSGCCW